MRSSFGSITRVGPNRWRLRWWSDGPDGRKRRSETVDGTRREAERRLAEIRVSTPCEYGGAPTVGHAWREWVLPMLRAKVDERSRDRSRGMSARTLSMREAEWRLRVGPRWESVPLDQVRPIDVQGWLLDGTMTLVLATNALSLLRQIMERAVIFGVVDSNPCCHDFAMPPRGVEMPRGCLTLDQLDERLMACRGSCCEAVAILCAMGGLRLGEAQGVRADEPRQDGAVVSVPVARSVDAHGIVGDLKTLQSERVAVIPLRPWGMRLMTLQAQAVMAGDEWLTDSGTGEPLSRKVIARAWDAATDGMEPRVTMRDLRRSYETAMHWELGMPLEKVQRLMGHAPGSAVTMASYDSPEQAQVAAELARSWAELGRDAR